VEWQQLLSSLKACLPSYRVAGVGFILKAPLEWAHTLTVATFLAFQLRSFIALPSAETAALHEGVWVILHLSTV